MRKVLIANRGAIARRIVRACHALKLESVVVFSEADAGAPYLEEASEAYPLSGVQAQDTYLNQAALLEVARSANVDAVHPGYGFLAEHAGFAQACIDAGLIFIGPRPHWLENMGDKVAARQLFADRGFPIFAGSKLLESSEAALAVAEQIGYPVLVKPAGGGGGMGMQIVTEADALMHAVKRAQAIATSAFASSGVYLEQLIQQPRHIEFQILGDGQGNAMHMYERECSVQRRNQKLIEESPAPGIDVALLRERAELAAQVCADLRYDNVGTLETLFTQDGAMGFLEMNTRIQVEHGVTEAITGCDLVALQIELARGGQLPEQPERQGFAIEARVYAEDPLTLLPSTGQLSQFDLPKMHGIRVETGYRVGQFITPYYDALIAKIIATGDTREMAIGRLLVALRAIQVQGVKTNTPLLMKILQNDAFLRGDVHTGLITAVMGEN